MIVRHFRLLVQIKDLRGRGLRPGGIAPLARLHPNVVERLTRQLRRYPAFEQLEYVYRRLLESDEAMKTGRGDLVTNLELLIVELAQAR
jgi:DNA polymerase-3 subunit delta